MKSPARRDRGSRSVRFVGERFEKPRHSAVQLGELEIGSAESGSTLFGGAPEVIFLLRGRDGTAS